MRHLVVFIHGAGADGASADEKLVASLRAALGSDYTVLYPRLPDPSNPRYDAWRQQLADTFSACNGPVIVVGHSLGGSILLKYLSEEPVEQGIVGLFTLAAPFWGMADWQADEYMLREDCAGRLPTGMPIFCYHSRDDDIVPFAHLAQYGGRLPQATLRVFVGRGHQFADDLSAVAADIASLNNGQDE